MLGMKLGQAWGCSRCTIWIKHGNEICFHPLLSTAMGQSSRVGSRMMGWKYDKMHLQYFYYVQQYTICSTSNYPVQFIFGNSWQFGKDICIVTASLYNVSKLSWYLNWGKQLLDIVELDFKISTIFLIFLSNWNWNIYLLSTGFDCDNVETVNPLKTEWVLACIIVNILLPTQSKRSFFVGAQSRSWQMKWHCQHKSCFLCQLLW